MTTELDLDDVAAQSPKAQKELEQLRQQRDELVAVLEDRHEVLGHNHWDKTMRHGQGCPICQRQFEWIRRAEQALANAGKEE